MNTFVFFKLPGHTANVSVFAYVEYPSAGTIEKRPGGLFICDNGGSRQCLGSGGNEEDVTGKGLFKSCAPGPADNEDAALLNPYHNAGSTGNEIILHANTFKN
ncbi:hypothetical protein D3H65_01340 [Paraflavitalea soli]|uniref:Uncharacterized protein n=1 Tax=Paraflavitalea soli TaxID=2315862 RepID=A0A3B7MED0_9BACT|nr:hypothetical protein [Paraflavitalea soli]AXY72698.1 hypothetical protein D3H65_01340 [Paraflavitalea soli]